MKSAKVEENNEDEKCLVNEKKLKEEKVIFNKKIDQNENVKLKKTKKVSKANNDCTMEGKKKTKTKKK